MMFYGILGIIYLNDKSYIILSVIGLILGILNIVLAVFAASQPFLIAVIMVYLSIVNAFIVLVLKLKRSLSFLHQFRWNTRCMTSWKII